MSLSANQQPTVAGHLDDAHSNHVGGVLGRKHKIIHIFW